MPQDLEIPVNPIIDAIEMAKKAGMRKVAFITSKNLVNETELVLVFTLPQDPTNEKYCARVVGNHLSLQVLKEAVNSASSLFENPKGDKVAVSSVTRLKP